VAHMKYGVSIFPTDTSIRPDELAREVEARGFDSLWFPEHSHIPTSRKTPWGGKEGMPPLPEQYWRTLDQFVALAYAASATTDLRLGAGITLLAQRDPIWTAKEVATVDHLSGGRVNFGVGYGWNKEEMTHHGVAYKDRRALMREKILMMKALWTEEEASFEGERISLEPSWAWPKPVQKPHPPVFLGADPGPKTLADIVEYCDGWLPNARRYNISEQVDKVRQALADAGRDVSDFQIVAYAAKTDMVEDLTEAGVHGMVFSLPPLGPDVCIPKLDEWARELGL
jgi:probable F420-dependent oxidoreductase